MTRSGRLTFRVGDQEFEADGSFGFDIGSPPAPVPVPLLEVPLTVEGQAKLELAAWPGGETSVELTFQDGTMARVCDAHVHTVEDGMVVHGTALERRQWLTCATCGQRFLSEWMDEEARAELAETGVAVEDCLVVCDRCYRQPPVEGGTP